MTTIVGTVLGSKHRVWTSGWVAFLIGSALGGFLGMRGGATAAEAHAKANTVPIAEYLRECDESERIGVLYCEQRFQDARIAARRAKALKLHGLK